MAHVTDSINRADVLLLRILDVFFSQQGGLAAQLWNSNRPTVEAYLAQHLGPVAAQQRPQGAAAAAIEVLEHFVNTTDNLVLRAAWGRFKPAIAAVVEKEFGLAAA